MKNFVCSCGHAHLFRARSIATTYRKSPVFAWQCGAAESFNIIVIIVIKHQHGLTGGTALACAWKNTTRHIETRMTRFPLFLARCPCPYDISHAHALSGLGLVRYYDWLFSSWRHGSRQDTHRIQSSVKTTTHRDEQTTLRRREYNSDSIVFLSKDVA